MKKARTIIVNLILVISLIALSACEAEKIVALDEAFLPQAAVQKTIRKVESFPDIPANYSYFDYGQAAIKFDEVAFSFAYDEKEVTPSFDPTDTSTWDPAGFWIVPKRPPATYDPLTTGYLKTSFGLPTYIGDNRVQSSGSEPMTTVSAVLGASFAGIDKSAQVFGDKTYDFVEMILRSYDTGSKLVKNVGVQGQSFWYDIFPQIAFTRLYYMYPDVPYMKEMVLNGANEWLEALPNFKKNGVEDYEFVGYNVVLESPTTEGDHIEPPNGGLAFLFYAAYEITGEQKYLDGAKQVLDYLTTYPKNPNYEAMTDYAPFVAAALNYRYGTSYDVGAFLDYLFEGDSAFRPGWSVLGGSFGGYPVDGLVGQGGDYAFSMNSFHLASTLAPMVKYDVRFADVIGKYLLNLVNNAKIFFAQEIPLDHQTMNGYLPSDKSGAVCYEGFRNYYAGVNGLAMGDATAMFGQPCDLSVYSSAYIGALGGIVDETDIKGILKVDLNATDSFGLNDYETYLFYNPYDRDEVVTFDCGEKKCDLFDAVSLSYSAKRVAGKVRLRIPAKSSKVIKVLPTTAKVSEKGGAIVAANVKVAQDYAATDIGLSSRQEINSASRIKLAYSAAENDKVVRMIIKFDDIAVYDGEPIGTFTPDKSKLPDTDYTMRVTIVTENGLTDTASKRVVVR